MSLALCQSAPRTRGPGALGPRVAFNADLTGFTFAYETGPPRPRPRATMTLPPGGVMDNRSPPPLVASAHSHTPPATVGDAHGRDRKARTRTDVNAFAMMPADDALTPPMERASNPESDGRLDLGARDPPSAPVPERGPCPDRWSCASETGEARWQSRWGRGQVGRAAGRRSAAAGRSSERAGGSVTSPAGHRPRQGRPEVVRSCAPALQCKGGATGNKTVSRCRTTTAGMGPPAWWNDMMERPGGVCNVPIHGSAARPPAPAGAGEGALAGSSSDSLPC